MVNRLYIEPEIVILPVGTVLALCDGSGASGNSDPGSIGGNGNGGSQGDSRSPYRVYPF